MTLPQTLGALAAWFVLGQARIVFGSRDGRAPHRRRGPESGAAFTRAAAGARSEAANYDVQGRRLLPWYLTVTRAYWLLVAAICCWAIYER